MNDSARLVSDIGTTSRGRACTQPQSQPLYKLAPYNLHGPVGSAAIESPIGRGLKRDSITAGLDSSPTSVESPDQQNATDHNGRKKAVKRACNECRQQKLRCDVQQDPFKICARCNRLKLECKIEENFKRVGKRSRNAEMEREIVELRKQVAAQHGTNLDPVHNGTYAHEAVAGLLDLRNSPGLKGSYKRLEDVTVPLDRIEELFTRFFNFNHPFVPLLNPERTPEDYHARSPFLFWTIIIIGSRHYNREHNLFGALAGPVSRLLWSSLAEVPQNYNVVKALILLCAWPLPTNSTSSDPTFILSGIMMQLALQMGLHRPGHAQDFTKFRVDLRQAELQDRVVVWAECNVAAQRIATAYGQPAITMYDWTLGPKPVESNSSYELPPLLFNRLLIEKFNDKVAGMLYAHPRNPVGLPDDDTRAQLVRILSQEFDELEEKIREDESPITNIYLKAAALHLHLSIFFSHQELPSYRSDMLKLYNTTTSFLEACLNLESSTSVNLPSNYVHGLSLCHGTHYIFHTMLAAGFSLLKLMRYFLGPHGLDMEGAKQLFTRTIWALRSTSVMENDLSERLAEVLAQVWKSGPTQKTLQDLSDPDKADEGGPLQLKVRCRRSMSLVYDSVWRWRRNFRDQRPPGGRFFNPSSTNVQPTAVEDTTGGSTPAHGISNDPSLTPATVQIVPGMAGMPTGMVEDFGTSNNTTTNNPDYNVFNNEVFDPLNWMLDGIVDFPYNFGNTVDPLAGQNGMGMMSTEGL